MDVSDLPVSELGAQLVLFLSAVLAWLWAVAAWCMGLVGPLAVAFGVVLATGLLWVCKRLLWGRSAGFYRCSLPGCKRWLRIRRFHGQGFRRYCGVHGYFERENPRDWAKGDRGVERFFVYLLQLDAEPWLYAGQTRNLRRRLREHREGTTKTTAGRRQSLVWYELVSSRGKAVRYEQQLKYWVRFRRGKIRRLVRRGPSSEARAVFEGRDAGRYRPVRQEVDRT